MKILRLLGLAMVALITIYAAEPGAAQNSSPDYTPKPSVLSAAAASPEALQAAQELVALVSDPVISDVTSSMVGQLWPVMEAALRRQYPQLSNKTATELRKEFYRLQRDYIARLMNDAPAIYVRHFTTEELRAVVAFYRTPIGAKALELTPQITAEAIAAAAPMMPLLQQEANQAFEEILRQHGYTLKRN